MIPGQVLSARNCHSLVAIISRTLLPEELPDKTVNRIGFPERTPHVQVPLCHLITS